MGEDNHAPDAGHAGDSAQDAREGTEQNTRGAGLTPAMRTVLWIVGALVVAGLATTIWLFATGGGPGTAASDPGSGPAATPTRGPIPGATPTTGSEVQTPDPTASAADRLPPRADATPLVTEPLPASGSAKGELVRGFPVDAMGPAPDSEALESSIATEGATMQVTLVARADSSAADLRAYYRTLWSGLGLAATESGDGSMTYSDGFSSLSLAFSPASGTGTVYMIFGVFRTS